MRSLLLGLCFVGTLAGSAAAANNDIVELGLGIRYLFDSDFYAADNPGVNYGTDTFPFAGDHAMGFGVHAALGHRFDSRRGPWDLLIKYYYTMGAEADETVNVPVGQSTIAENIVSSLDQHDLLFAVRMRGDNGLIPVPVLNSPSLTYDLGIGVTTLSYAMDVSLPGSPATLIESTTRTRSGLAFNFGLGWEHELSETLKLQVRGDFIFSKIQNVEDADGNVVHYSPNAHSAKLMIGVSKSFDARF